jgi:hypothetical protein
MIIKSRGIDVVYIFLQLEIVNHSIFHNCSTKQIHEALLNNTIDKANPSKSNF